jgi:hypothetical protein
MHSASKVFWSFEPALKERFINDDLGGDVRQFTSLPGFHLFAHGLEVSLHSVNTDRNAVD